MQQYEAVLPLQLKDLKLSMFNLHWQDSVAIASKNNWTYTQYLSNLCDLEIQKRKDNRLARRSKESKLPAGKILSSFDFSSNKMVNSAQINALAESNAWIKKANNLIIFGPSGVGKTHIAAAIGYRQIELGVKVKFFQAATKQQFFCNFQSSSTFSLIVFIHF